MKASFEQLLSLYFLMANEVQKHRDNAFCELEGRE